MNDQPQDPLTHQVLNGVFEVANTLGPGFLEKVYERALKHELELRGFHVQSQVAFAVLYKGKNVGDYLPDLLVNDQLILELKSVDTFTRDHMAQCINYLKAANLKTCLLLNFQNATVKYKRISL